MIFDLGPDVRELRDVAFACLPGCGWCCTHPAEVDKEEERAIRALRPNVKLGFDGERTYLRLQGGCGACQFLEKDRTCGIYEARPGHCRWFPFHVYFGRRVEIVLNRSCPGLAAAPGASLEEEARATLATADPATVRRNLDESAAAHRQFRANCEEAGVWGDVDAAIAEVLALGPAVFRRDVLEDLADVPARDLLDVALASFESGDPTKRPYHVDPKFAWLVFQRRAQRIGVADLAADGRLALKQVVPIAGWEDLPEPLAAELFPHFRALLARESFAGSVFDRVDEHAYEIPVEDAAREEAALVVADLVVRARLVAALGDVSDVRYWAAEARRFYDSDFLDRPAIGAWL